MIGLTVVAFGTSAPELAVNMIGASAGNTQLCFGNVIGSNMANVGLIVALTAILYPMNVRRIVVRREIPMMLLSTAVVFVMASDSFLQSGTSVGTQPTIAVANMFDRSDSLLLLLFFSIFMYYNIGDVFLQRAESRQNVQSIHAPAGQGKVIRDLALTVLGLGLLIGGGKLTVDSAVLLAIRANVSETVIGLTLVAVGTSLPELVTAILAAAKGESDLAIGNIVGSNIFNLLFVMGSVAFVRDVPVPQGGHMDLLVVSILSGMLFLFTYTHNRRVLRGEGIALLVIYLGYIAWRTMNVIDIAATA